MTTATKERRLGTPRGDIERLMEHRGISMGEAEELLRTHPVEALLPQRGTGFLLGTAAGIASPDPKFAKDLCFFPTALRVDEPFTPKWVIDNQGDSGEIALGMIYKGEAYLLWRGILESGQRGTLTTTEPIVITDLVDEIDRTQTIELSFITGYFTGEMTIAVTDTWDVAVYVEVAGGIAWWPWLIGAGVVAVGVGIVLVGEK